MPCRTTLELVVGFNRPHSDAEGAMLVQGCLGTLRPYLPSGRLKLVSFTSAYSQPFPVEEPCYWESLVTVALYLSRPIAPGNAFATTLRALKLLQRRLLLLEVCTAICRTEVVVHSHRPS